MVTNRIQHSARTPVKQGAGARDPEPNKINASTPFDFSGKNLTPYGGLLPVATMLEKLGFQTLLEEAVTVKRLTRVMSGYQFLFAMVLGLYIGFSRLNQLRFIARDPILTGILKIVQLPPDHKRSRHGRLIQDKAWPLACASGQHIVAFSGSTARECGPTDPAGAVRDAPARMGSGQREAEDRNPGHGHDGTHAVRNSDGSAQELQPKEQGQEKLPADTDVSGRDAGIRGRRVAQWRQAVRRTNRPALAKRLPVAARRYRETLRARGFGLLLLGSSGRVPKGGMPVHRGGAQDIAAGGKVAASGMEAVAGDPKVRDSLFTD